MARVFTRTNRHTQEQVIAVFAVSIAEVRSWLHESAWRVRELRCPQCHAACKQLYLVPWRNTLFVCYKCAKLPKKRAIDISNNPNAISGNTGLSALAQKRNLTLAELAPLLGTTSASLCRWENGHFPIPEHVRILLFLLSVRRIEKKVRLFLTLPLDS